ncbi:hypothetical protein BH20VER2_BH20VER2_03570 [soil metagenome]
MPGDNDIWKSQQPGENVVVQDRAREILEEHLPLLLVNIEADVTEPARF